MPFDMTDPVTPQKDSLAGSDYGLKYQGNVGRPSNEILADILKQKSTPRPSTKATLAAALAGVAAGVIAEKAAPGSGAATGLQVAGSIAGNSAANAKEKADQRTGVLLKELDNRQKSLEALRELYKTNPRGFPKDAAVFSAMMDLPGNIDPMATINAELEDKRLKQQVEFAAELTKAGFEKNNPMMAIEGIKGSARLLGYKLSDGFEKSIMAASQEEQIKGFIKEVGIVPGRNAVRVALATGTNPWEHMDLVDRDLRLSPEFTRAHEEVAKSEVAAAAFAELDKISEAYRSDPVSFRGLSVQQMAEKAGADYITLSALPKAILDQLNYDDKAELANLRRQDAMTKLLFNFGTDGMFSDMLDGQERIDAGVRALATSTATSSMATVRKNATAITRRATEIVTKEHPEWTGTEGLKKAYAQAEAEFKAVEDAAREVPIPNMPNAEEQP